MRAVSGPISACIAPAATRLTVRHTPFTDTLSPSCSSDASVVAIAMRIPASVAVTSPMRPTDSMRPVNIAFDQHVGAQQLDATFEQRSGREAPAGHHRHSAVANPGTRHVYLDEVHESAFPQRGMEFSTAFNQQALHVAHGK